MPLGSKESTNKKPRPQAPWLREAKEAEPLPHRISGLTGEAMHMEKEKDTRVHTEGSQLETKPLTPAGWLQGGAASRSREGLETPAGALSQLETLK